MLRCFKLSLLFGLLLLSGFARAEEDYFDSNGVRIHYLVEGKGDPVLLIHGFASNYQFQWITPGIFKALVKDYRVIALDVRGHGKSEKPTDPDKYGTEMVEDAVRLLDHLKIKKAHVVGYSMGALITGKLLATHPDRVLSATLGGTGVFPEGVEQPPFIEKLAQSLEEGKGMGPLLTALSPSGKSKLPASTINKLLVRGNGKALAAVVRSWKKLGVSKEQLKANKVPTLALIGSKDPLKASIDIIKDDMENLQVVVIEGKDHLTAYINPRFVRELRKFLAEHSQKKQTKERAESRQGQPLFPWIRLRWEISPDSANVLQKTFCILAQHGQTAQESIQLPNRKGGSRQNLNCNEHLGLWREVQRLRRLQNSVLKCSGDRLHSGPLLNHSPVVNKIGLCPIRPI